MIYRAVIANLKIGLRPSFPVDQNQCNFLLYVFLLLANGYNIRGMLLGTITHTLTLFSASLSFVIGLHSATTWRLCRHRNSYYHQGSKRCIQTDRHTHLGVLSILYSGREFTLKTIVSSPPKIARKTGQTRDTSSSFPPLDVYV